MAAHPAPGIAPTNTRVFLSDVKPYAVVDSLDDLHGPRTGVVILPHSLLWAPGGGDVDLDAPGGVELAYRAVLSEGTPDDLVKLLNRHRLLEVWADLMLPRRVRALWQARFPELASASSSPDVL